MERTAPNRKSIPATDAAQAVQAEMIAAAAAAQRVKQAVASLPPAATPQQLIDRAEEPVTTLSNEPALQEHEVEAALARLFGSVEPAESARNGGDRGDRGDRGGRGEPGGDVDLNVDLNLGMDSAQPEPEPVMHADGHGLGEGLEPEPGPIDPTEAIWYAQPGKSAEPTAPTGDYQSHALTNLCSGQLDRAWSALIPALTYVRQQRDELAATLQATRDPELAQRKLTGKYLELIGRAKLLELEGQSHELHRRLLEELLAALRPCLDEVTRQRLDELTI